MQRAGLLVTAMALAVGAWGLPRPDAWLEVHSPHFQVFSNADADSAREVAGELERMRIVFQQAFPHLQVDPPMPILVLAVRGRKDFDALSPSEDVGKGKMQLAGLFQRSPERNFIMLRLDALEGDFPYEIVYHEYTHLLSSKDLGVFPLWLAEGLAEFYETAGIQRNEVSLGRPDPNNLYLLRSHRMLTLSELFAVDYNSPYYHEDDKASIFYAESWALTHYLMMRDRMQHTQMLASFVALLQQHVAPAIAAQQAFGDLAALQKELGRYIESQSFRYVTFKISDEVHDQAWPVTPVAGPQADAVRADFMAHFGRSSDAEALLRTVLAADPNNLEALETMGFAATQQGKMEDALHYYGQAAAQGSQDFLAQFYYGAMTLQAHGGSLDAATAAQIKLSLESAMKLNPNFAPAYDRLAVLYQQQRMNLEEAHQLELQAIELEPGNVAYRMNAASVLVAMDRAPEALTALNDALPLTKTPAEKQQVLLRLNMTRQYIDAQQQYAARVAQLKQAEGTPPAAISGTAAAPPPPASGPPEIARRTPPAAPDDGARILSGKIQAVHCGPGNAIEIDLRVPQGVEAMHISDFRAVALRALNFTPSAGLNPCTDLTGLNAKFIFRGDHTSELDLSK